MLSNQELSARRKRFYGAYLRLLWSGDERAQRMALREVARCRDELERRFAMAMQAALGRVRSGL